jgi:hypothetical protein
MSNGPLKTLQARGVTLLDADSYFANKAVIEISDGTIAQRIQQTLFARGLASKDGNKTVIGGLACIVSIRTMAVESSRRLRASVLLSVAVLENPLLNTSAISALDVCVEVFRVLHNQAALAGVPVMSATALILAAEQNALQIIGQEERRSLYGIEGGNAWHCNFSVNSLALT